MFVPVDRTRKPLIPGIAALRSHLPRSIFDGGADTGPGFQLINQFLREMGKLSVDMRTKFARCAELTYAATTRAICSAIRKLARVNLHGGAPRDGPLATAHRFSAAACHGISDTGEVDGVRWRGVRGQLPLSFYRQDERGEFTATDLGFMSTSTTSETPMRTYMHGVSNVLWELHTRPEDEHGYHQGADVSMLSQFQDEKEELFPPLTMLRVLPRAGIHTEASTPSPLSRKMTTSLAKWLSNAIEAGNENADAACDSSQRAAEDEGKGEPKAGSVASLEAFMRDYQAELMTTADERKILRIVVEPTFI